MVMASTTEEQDHHGHGHVAHHFDSAQQQFDAGKLGMWLFLITEILFFSGLFVAYAVYRVNHPEVFIDARQHLNTSLGALNTVVLLFSSLTMAWAVRAAQLGQHKLLSNLIILTLLCASVFLGIKSIEYSHKWGEGLLWAGAYTYGSEELIEHDKSAAKLAATAALGAPAALIVVVSGAILVFWRRRLSSVVRTLVAVTLGMGAIYFVGVGIGIIVEVLTHSSVSHASGDHSISQVAGTPGPGVFFSIYFTMTGVHALHILIGMGVMLWMLEKSLRFEYGPDYFGPVDFVGLYWHLVDLVWIYLFPLLYLIG